MTPAEFRAAGKATGDMRRAGRTLEEQWAVHQLRALGNAIYRYRLRFARDRSELNHMRCVHALASLRGQVRSWERTREERRRKR